MIVIPLDSLQALAHNNKFKISSRKLLFKWFFGVADHESDVKKELKMVETSLKPLTEMKMINKFRKL